MERNGLSPPNRAMRERGFPPWHRTVTQSLAAPSIRTVSGSGTLACRSCKDVNFLLGDAPLAILGSGFWFAQQIFDHSNKSFVLVGFSQK